MRGAYTAGALDFLLENNIEFPYVIGTSAGALNACSFISGDIGRNKKIMLEFMHSLKFASVSNYIFKGSFFDFDYLFFEIQNVLPFNWDKFNSSQVRLLCGTTSFKTGEAVYFEKGKDDNFPQAVAASSSLPATIRKPVIVNGEPYCDGGPTCSVPFKKAIEDGYQRLFVISTQVKGHRKQPDSEKLPLYLRRYTKDYPEFIKAFKKWSATYNDDFDEIDHLAEEGKIFALYPSREPGVGVASRDKEAVESLYELGRNDMKLHFDELLDYLKQDF